ncbi:GAF domain-containing protein [Pontibacter sp. BT310]|uniref:GAF domain-containing protein n=1 Tax=Pontibacter populi TaxID=890055 RepID=A0ABS6X6P0_9BACT|nr:MULTISPECIES: GAF domain-containing protein [Pontibacter]MBJ6116800.1 GAF domain-containing protein [Pontibacter sp. BT310]MBR0569222.1 GAF domain-containing protein [Microvirga sp. STS03]MBW3363653.1 GAF domain-containing protein [Pontibacter populi]
MSNPRSSFHETVVSITNKDEIILSTDKFPFRTTLSLSPLVAYWENKVKTDPSCNISRVKELADLLRKTPNLLKPLDDTSLIDEHISTIDILMEDIFPSALWENDLRATVLPFHFESFYATPRLEELQLLGGGNYTGKLNLDLKTLLFRLTLSAYTIILEKFYKANFVVDQPFIFVIKDKFTQLERHYKLSIDLKFMDVKLTGELKQLKPQEINFLINRYNNLDLWMKWLPPENFEFTGFAIYDFTDVTMEETISSLRYDLLEQDAVTSEGSIRSLQQKLRVLFGLPGIKFGLASCPAMQEFDTTYARKIWNGLVFTQNSDLKMDDLRGSIYEPVIKHGHTIIVEDLKLFSSPTRIEKILLEDGIRNLIIAPLQYEGHIIGLLEVASPIPGELNALSMIRLKEILPLFALAMHRGLEELRSSIQNVIKEKYTAIHPVVEWRFTQAAINFLDKMERNATAEIEPIVFRDIYPLYGVSDVRSSAIERNKAIQGDLLDQLVLAKEVLLSAKDNLPLPILDELTFKIDKFSQNIMAELAPDDEAQVLEFLRSEVEALFNYFLKTNPQTEQTIKRYKNAITNPHHVVYNKRRAYEESLYLINETISSFLDREEEKAQQIFPHYFEKYKTDGLEYNIYIGASLLNSGNFEKIYLKNMRLWQLMLTCEIARRIQNLRATLKLPLEIAQLILVHSDPISIKFRLDEKKFDVEGASNIRYEIIKKRLDKATVQDAAERLTQPGKIAIVYTQQKEAVEYMRYIEFLQSEGYIEKDVEMLEIDEMQGVQGLRAIRVSVSFKEQLRHDIDSGDELLAIAQSASLN